MKLVSLYTGAGGLDIGFEAAGFETSVCVEFDSQAVETLRFNRPWRVISKDIHDTPSLEILGEAKLSEGEADVLIGGPPCQPFSKSGFWARGDTRRLDDPRASTLEQYLRVLRDIKPQAFLLENVPGLMYSGKDEGLQRFLQIVESINEEIGVNYQPTVQIVNAVDFGVPQDRKRVFIVGHREGKRFDFPTPTHGSPEQLRALPGEVQLEEQRTAWDALGDLDILQSDGELAITGKWGDLLPSIPEGSNYLYHTDRGGGVPLFGWRRRYWSFLLKLSKRLPSWTITAQPGSAIGPFHWKNRRLSGRELCRLQTFPDDYHIVGGRTSIQRQLGNAVPCALAERLALSIREQLLGDGAAHRRQATLLPPRRLPVPPPEPVAPVPEKYSHLIGEHVAHPGTGEGFGAQRRKVT